MPTFSKLVAALILAAGAWWSGSVILSGPDLPVVARRFAEANAALGLILGWVVVGTSAGRGVVAAVSAGVSGGVALLVSSCALWSFLGMLRRALRTQYAGPVEGLVDAVRIMVEMAPFYFVPGALLGALGGGALAGIAAELLAERRRE
ncbi:TrgA family protein [Palleronia sp.]|uniref:TrgA family protein n=1 Tax=Palleronia sp. TaxID=1940284 RepID=UPI0035C7EFC4